MVCSFLSLPLSQAIHIYEVFLKANGSTSNLSFADATYLLHLVPFCLVLVLNDIERPFSYWASFVDILQIALIFSLVIAAIFLIPQPFLDAEDMARLSRLHNMLYSYGSVFIAAVAWCRTITNRSALEFSIYRLTSLYLTVLCIFAFLAYQWGNSIPLLQPWSGLLATVNYLVFFLLAAVWKAPEKNTQRVVRESRQFIGLFLPPGILPLVVLLIALQYPNPVSGYAKAAVAVSIILAFGRMMFTAVNEFQALQSQQQTEKHFYTLTQNLPGVVYICKNDQKFTNLYLSDQIEALTGYPKVECLIKGGLNGLLADPDAMPRIRVEIDRAIAARRPYRLTYRLMHRSGEVRWVEEYGAGIYDGDKLQYLCGFLSDITSRRKLEDHVRQAQKMDALGSLAGGVAHDFNNMLTAISGYAQLMEMKQDNELSEEVAGILTASKRAATLTKRLLTFSRQQKLNTAPLNLNSLLTDLEPMLTRLLTTQYQLHLEMDDELQRIQADSGQLEQVIINLVVNARDAMPEGGPITIMTLMVRVFEMDYNVIGLEPGDYATLAVMDQGTGIDPKVRAKIFEPFFTTKPEGKGTGLGLSTVYGIVKQHNGLIEVESGPGGTSFQLYFPTQMRPQPVHDLSPIETM